MQKPTISERAITTSSRVPTNSRSTEPRPIAVARAPWTASHALRWGARGDGPSGTPTPPPVAVGTPSNRGLRQALPAPTPPPKSMGRSLLALAVMTAAVAGVLLVTHRLVEGGAPGSLAAVAGRIEAVPAAPAGPPAADQEPVCSAADAACAAATASAGDEAESAADGSDAADGGSDAPVELRRDGPSAVPGGVLLVPSSFQPTSSAFDLVVHFHGDADVVRAGLEASSVDAAVAVVNLGAGSSVYHRAYQSPDAFQSLVRQAERALAARGLVDAHVRRLALSAWGVGQGAVASVLRSRGGLAQLDAVLLLDGIFGGSAAGPPSAATFGPFVSLAKAAAADELLFSLTYSQIDPQAPAVVAVLSEAAGTSAPEAEGERPAVLREVALPGITTVKRTPLQPLADARRGGFHARSFEGTSTQEHMAQLTQMAATTLRELGARWSAPSERGDEGE